jgi:magnesium chelatase subunit D
VERSDILEAARLALPHRLPRPSVEGEATSQVSLEQTLDRMAAEEIVPRPESHEGGGEAAPSLATRTPQGQVPAAGSVHPLRPVFTPRGEAWQPRGGRRVTIEAQGPTGRYVADTLPDRAGGFQIALGATVRAAAPRQAARLAGNLYDGNLALKLDWSDVRAKVRRRKVRSTVLFLVDASGSMGAGERMSETKGAVLSLLADARRRRDRVGLVSFRGSQADVLLAPTNDIARAEALLRLLPVGGATPLSRGLEVARDTLRRASRRGKEQALLIVISDGKPNRSLRGAAARQHREEEARTAFHAGRPGGACLFELCSAAALREALEVAEELKRSGIKSLVVDTAAPGRRNHMPQLAAALGADYVPLKDLRAGELVRLVGRSLALNDFRKRR